MNRRSSPLATSRTPVGTAVLLALAGWAASAPLGALAQSAPAAEPADAPGKMQEIVISAQKRTERLKDTPVAASVVSSELLERANATDIADLNNLVPSVQLKGSFNGRVPMAMRGISTSANEAAIGLTSGVAVLIDGVPVPADSTAANELQDVRRVEVLKGPQSTLGGRTASAGVINFVTNTPSKTWTGNVGASATSDGELRGNAFVSGPLADMLAFSVSAYGGHREYPIRNVLLGENSQSDNQGARAKLLFSPDKDLDITLAARAADSRSRGETFTYQYITPGATLFPFFPWAPGGVSQDVALPGITPHFGNTDYASPVHMSSKSNDQDLSLNIEKRVGDYTFTSTTAHQKETLRNVQDVPMVATYFLNDLRTGVIPDPPAGPPYFYNSQQFDIHPTQLTQEFKIASPLKQAVSYVAGVFYSDMKVEQESLRVMFVNPLDNTVESVTKSLGIYGRATWNIGEDTSLLTGLRYNRDKVSYSIDDRAGGFASAASDSASATVGDLTLRQKLGKDQMVYGTLSKGYKPRAFNTAETLTSNDPLAPVDKESITHFELGAKNTLLDGKLNLSTALFNTEYKNYQVQIYNNASVISLLTLDNAGRARTRGLEMDATWAAGEDTRLTVSAAYIDAQFQKYDGAPCYPGQTEAQGCSTDADGKTTQNLAGKTMPDSPKFKMTLGLDHGLSQSLIPWDLRLNAQYAYRTAANFQADQNPYTRQGAFGILNLGATASSPDGRYSVSLFVNNVFDKFYLVNAEDFFSGLWGGTSNAVIGQPARDARRFAGLKFNVAFD